MRAATTTTKRMRMVIEKQGKDAHAQDVGSNGNCPLSTGEVGTHPATTLNSRAATNSRTL
eukprot:9294090-Pyramimonas_sp.AAC.1